jgi:osmotically-inducible protein OsmY
MSDHALERRIADALAADPRVDDDTIAVECGESGYAVLRGSAGSPAKDTRALRTASAVSGVDGVNNQLRPRRLGVGPRHDARTEAAVLRAFIADDALPAGTMPVSASDGTVTLRGRVDFAYPRDEAEAAARRVPGVSQLRNELDVWSAISPNQVLEQVTGGRVAGGSCTPRLSQNRVGARLALAPPTPPGMRVRTGRFAQHSRKRR